MLIKIGRIDIRWNRFFITKTGFKPKNCTQIYQNCRGFVVQIIVKHYPKSELRQLLQPRNNGPADKLNIP